MNMGDFEQSRGGGLTPVSPLSYKRAIIHPAPPEFTVEVLDPTKQGSHFSYGVRISPIVRFRRGSDSRSQKSSDSQSSSSYSEYDIWRRWEDCLDFQETLEQEYSTLSRDKVRMLNRMKSGKKKHEEPDGPYRSRNAAASFESLPEGPDPREVVMDVHELIPTLTRKASLFRVGRNTINQRGSEFAALIQALFSPSPDAPVLLQELRNCSSVRDFFAFWRRDKDLLKKAGKGIPRFRHSNHSLLSLSNFTFMTSSTAPSSPAVPLFPRANSPPAFLRHSMFTRTTTELHGEAIASKPAPAVPGGFFPDSPTTLSQSRTALCHPVMATEAGPGSIMFTDEQLLEDEPVDVDKSTPHRRVLSHCPVPQSPRHLPSSEIYSHTLNTRVPSPIPEEDFNNLSRPQPRQSNSATLLGHRNARIFIPAPSSELGIVETSPKYSPRDKLSNNGPNSPSSTQKILQVDAASPPSSSYAHSVSSDPSSSMIRFSVASSISSYTQGSWRDSCHESEFSYDSESCFDPDLPYSSSPVIPLTPLAEIAEAKILGPGHKSRASASSFASFRTEVSAEGVLPRHLHPQVNFPPARVSTLPLDDDRSQSPIEPISEDDLVDAYFTDSATYSRFSMEALNKELPPVYDHKGKNSISSISSIGSVDSTFSVGNLRAPLSPRDNAFIVKTVYNEYVIVFRAEHTMNLATIRQRIQERFHEDVLLDEDFLLGYIPSRKTINGVGRTERSNSVTSTASDLSHLRILETETDWQAAMINSNGKLTLRVLDPDLCL